jgi:hypothetical protein
MFVLPILLIFAVSVLGASSRRVKVFIEENLRTIKLLIAGIFFLLATMVATNSDPRVLINGMRGLFGNGQKPAASPVNQESTASKAKYTGIDLGDVPSSKIYQGVLRFPFAIKSVTTSCDCLKVSTGPVSLGKDNKEWIVKFDFDPKGYYGYVEQEMRIVAESGQLLILQFKGNVTGEKPSAK